jgi:enamine deaminase RidA (YjgF/YER057c/UK114 family)
VLDGRGSELAFYRNLGCGVTDIEGGSGLSYPAANRLRLVNNRQLISSGSPYEKRIGFSRAVRVGNHISVSGTAPIWPDDWCDPDPATQARRCLEIIMDALAEAGAGPQHVFRTRTYLTRSVYWEAVAAVHGEIFGAIRPASTAVVVAALLDPRWKVEIEADALLV